MLKKLKRRKQLKEAAKLLENHWGTGSYALDEAGSFTDPLGPYAVKWCALGALRKITGEAHSEAEMHLRRTAEKFFNTSVERLNDGEGHEAVKKLYAKATRWLS